MADTLTLGTHKGETSMKPKTKATLAELILRDIAYISELHAIGKTTNSFYISLRDDHCENCGEEGGTVVETTLRKTKAWICAQCSHVQPFIRPVRKK